jgi:ABC-type antimicrobial peptide transport system permease subunit
MAATVRGIVRELDPGLVVYGLEPLEQTLANSLVEQRFVMLLLSAFAALALLLAAIGMHGVLSCAVAQQQREIALRMALGADAGAVRRAVVRHGSALTAIGLALGCMLALALGRFLSGMLAGVSATDLRTLVTVIGVLGVVAACSIWIPTRRAVRVDPLVALRQE